MSGAQISKLNLMIIRDPIHGNIHISKPEQKLIDHPYFQRLRTIKQLGFTDLAFPGATHSRYSHSLGTMYVASLIFDKLFSQIEVDEEKKAFLKQIVRLAALLHDIGHAPLSHATEIAMPKLSMLKMEKIYRQESFDPEVQASHEDYTVKILVDSELTALLQNFYPETSDFPFLIAHLISKNVELDFSPFVIDGVDYRPILRQMVSGELDADRMDYLFRDSFYTGVSYGKYDIHWLIHCLTPVFLDGKCFTGLNRRGVLAFEDFLLCRYSMFMSVYLHYSTACFETMLYEAIKESGYQIPHLLEEYQHHDDVFLLSFLRQSSGEFSKLISKRKAYKMVFDLENNQGEKGSFEDIQKKLKECKIRFLANQSSVKISKPVDELSLYVADEKNKALRMDQYSSLYRQYQNPISIFRVYAHPEDWKLKRDIIEEILSQ